jgi:DNA-binding transcriptional regulator YdaS (Cro superfamily)
MEVQKTHDHRPILSRASPMTPDGFHAALSTIGWTKRGLADRLGVHETRIRRWASGVCPIPTSVAKWLRSLAKCHELRPLPKDWKTGDQSAEAARRPSQAAE